MKDTQKLATKIFITASLLFGTTGVIMILSAPKGGEPAEWLAKLLGIFGFTVLSSFGVSVGFKYLSGK
jgi:hypothetical protein